MTLARAAALAALVAACSPPRAAAAADAAPAPRLRVEAELTGQPPLVFEETGADAWRLRAGESELTARRAGEEITVDDRGAPAATLAPHPAAGYGDVLLLAGVETARVFRPTGGGVELIDPSGVALYRAHPAPDGSLVVRDAAGRAVLTLTTEGGAAVVRSPDGAVVGHIRGARGLDLPAVLAAGQLPPAGVAAVAAALSRRP